jgi:DNA/RNA-binding domain of Phe-tRNA-synthetase-like protein
VDALITRVLRDQALARVNALVDLYNAISIRHVVPLGGEDADRLEGPLRLTLAAGRRAFRSPGDGIEAEPVPAGDVASSPVASAPAASAAPVPEPTPGFTGEFF